MKYIITLLLLCMVTSLSYSQQKKFDEIKTASPIFFYIYEGESGDGAIELQIHDREHQFVSMGYDRLADQARGNDPKNPLIKLIQIPEVSLRAFRQAESLEEAKMVVDGLTVITVRLNSLKEAARIMYQ